MAAGGANTINCWIERDRDQLMRRTHGRPLPQGEIDPTNALVFGIVLNVLAFALLATVANLLAAVLTLLGDAVLRLRLHDLAEAAHGAEHRDRRRGRRGTGARRLGRGARRPRGAGVDPVRGRVRLDARALLGARDEVPRRLRRRRHPDAAGGARRGGHRPPDRGLRDDHGVADARAHARPARSVGSTRSRRRCSARCSCSRRSRSGGTRRRGGRSASSRSRTCT